VDETSPAHEKAKQGGSGKESPFACGDILAETRNRIPDRSIMNGNESNKIQIYRDSVCILSYDLALLALMAKRVEQNELTDAKYAEAVLAEIESDKNRFLDAREALGLDAGQDALAAFTEDHFFDGFSVQGSKFEGDRQSADRVCREWIKDMPTSPSEEEATRYEYGTYILMLSGSAQMVFPKMAADRGKRSKFSERVSGVCRLVWNKVLPVLQGKNGRLALGFRNAREAGGRKRAA